MVSVVVPKRTDDWSGDVQKELVSFMPPQARPQDELDEASKSYTIWEAAVEGGPNVATPGSSPIQVLLRERAFYVVKSPTELPDHLLKGSYKTNLKGGCRVGFKKNIAKDWVDAMVIASWTSHVSEL